jgi:hypothetical protein
LPGTGCAVEGMAIRITDVAGSVRGISEPKRAALRLHCKKCVRAQLRSQGTLDRHSRTEKGGPGGSPSRGDETRKSGPQPRAILNYRLWVILIVVARRAILLEALERHPNVAVFHFNLALDECQLGKKEDVQHRLRIAFTIERAFLQEALDDEDLRPL